MFNKLIFIGLTILTTALSAQETWSLERCITYAQEQNRTIKQSQVQVKGAKLTQKQDKMAVYPTVNASSNLGFNFGRSVNPATYQFQSINTAYNSWGVSANATIYNGGRIRNQIRQSEVDVQAAQADLEQSAQTIAVQVAQAYLQILLNAEQLKNAEKRIQTTQEQLAQTEKRIKAGALPANSRLDIQAQIARDEQTIVTNQNNVELSYLNLKNLLELPIDKDIKIETPSVIVPENANPDGYVFKILYNQALSSQPQVHAGELRIKSAEIGVKIAEAQLKPSLFANGNISSNYSNAILDFTKGKPITIASTQNVTIDGRNVPVTFYQASVTDVPKKSYFSQFGDNLGQSIGFQLQIPIFDGFQRRNGVERQKLNVESQTLSLERSKQQLRSDVQTSIANAKAARKQYQAAQKTYDAVKSAFEATEKRLQTGAANAFEYTQARNNLDNAERDATVAKYDYLFKLKLVEFYEGKKMTLK